MNPRQFEKLVCSYFQNQGYNTRMTPYSNDYGVDVFAEKSNEKIAVQAKMYGGSSRRINRQMVMELHGAKDYFDCTKAIIATDGDLLSDAKQVAEKLGIEILYLDGHHAVPESNQNNQERTFEGIWEEFIIPLQGKTLTRNNGDTNVIVKADWSGIERITSNGNPGKIKIEIFRMAIQKLLKDGFITKDEINQNYAGRASSGIILILSQVPFFRVTDRPIGLEYSG
jgi:hypothetical protein